MVDVPQMRQEQPETPYKRIRDAILDGRLAAGAPLVESSLASWCGVSRTPIREALTRLEQDGIVEREAGRLRVRARSPEEILDIYEVRISLEATATRMAAERHRLFDQVELERLMNACEQVEGAPGNTSAMSTANRAFHRAVWNASHNASLVDLLTRLDSHLARYPETTLAVPDRWKIALEEHRQIVEAILARDTARAGEVAERHFSEARDIRLSLWQTGTPSTETSA